MKPLRNNKVLRTLSIIERLEAGIVLHGDEVKAIKGGRMALDGAYVMIKDNAVWLTNAHIRPYQPNQPKSSSADRDRKLLLRREELDSLIGTMRAQGLTCVPVSVYSKAGIIKIELGVARGKKAYDAREDIKKRDVARKISRTMRAKR